MATAPAHATNGYFANGYGAPSKAMAGAGVAVGEGPLAPAQNPALGVEVGNVAGLCFTGFMPHRYTDSTNTNMVGGRVESNNEFFPIVCGGVNYMLSDDTSLGLVMYGNGGMNTEYDTNVFAKFNDNPTVTGESTPLGVDLAQAFFALNGAHKVTPTLSVGAAPVLAVQRFKAYGLEPFFGSSDFADKLTNNGYDWSYGGGFKLGANWDATNWLRFGVNYQSRMWMTPFDKYKGLFAEGGDFDIPSTIGEAIAIKPHKDLVLTVEHQRIFYEDVASISNSHVNGGQYLHLGSDQGAGFGWKDMDIFRIAAQYKATDALTLRTGFSYATKFTDDQEVLFNILAPATIRTHVGVGATYKFNEV
ncbi:MAG: outer membrane protein transport protein, partial [Pseudomonadota bacterium]